MQHKRTYNRTDILAIILLGFMVIFVLRLFWLQIVNHEEYVQMAKQNQQRSFAIPASRGEIYMMDKDKAVPVVLNQAVYTVIADPETVKDNEHAKIIREIRSIAGGEMVKDAETRIGNNKSRYEVLARNVSRNQAEVLKKFDFAGIGFQRTSIRNYPEGQLAAQVLGFVNAEGKGQYGVEQQLDQSLRGQDGLLQSVTDVRNVPLTVGKDNVRIEPRPGENIILSIDRNIQSQAEQVLKAGIEKANATEGSVLVMNPDNGEILAMANYPTFSPSEYFKEQNPAVFMNTITMAPYEPASVIKTFTLAAGIDRGVISPQSTYQNVDCIPIFGTDQPMCNALRGHAGTKTMQEVLNNSFNVGTITVARELGGTDRVNLEARKIMYDYFHEKFGLGEKTNVEVAEAEGYIYPPGSVEGNEVRYSAMTFGQSLNLTMIQVAAGFAQ